MGSDPDPEACWFMAFGIEGLDTGIFKILKVPKSEVLGSWHFEVEEKNSLDSKTAHEAHKDLQTPFASTKTAQLATPYPGR